MESRETTLQVGPLALDLIERTARRGDRVIDLLPREFRLLEYMMRRSDQLLTRAMLLEEVWNYKFVRRPIWSTYIRGACATRWTDRAKPL